MWQRPHQARLHPMSTWHTLDAQALSLPEGVRACGPERQVHGSTPATPYTCLSERPQPISVCGPSYDNCSALDKLPSTPASTPHCQRSSRAGHEAVAGARGLSSVTVSRVLLSCGPHLRTVPLAGL